MKKAFVVVDFQNDFVSGSLGFPEAIALDEKISEKIEKYLKEGYDIIYTFDTHYENYSETQEGKKLPVPHCIKGTDGYNIYGKTASFLSFAKTKIEKNVFGSLKLGEFLQKENYDTVELCGLVSNICVISNAVIAKSALPEAAIVVDASLTAGADLSMHEKALDVMESLQIEVIR